MKRTRPSARRLAFAAVLAATFVVTASFFAPHLRQAEGAGGGPAPLAQPAIVAGDSVAGLPLLGHLEGGAYTVKIYGSPDGPLYSVFNAEGTRLASLLPASQVAERFPQHHIPEALADVPGPAQHGGSEW